MPLTEDDRSLVVNEINRLYDTSQAELDELNRYLVQPTDRRRPPAADKLRTWADEKARFEARVDVLGKASFHVSVDGFEVGLAKLVQRVIAIYLPGEAAARSAALDTLSDVCSIVSGRVPA